MSDDDPSIVVTYQERSRRLLDNLDKLTKVRKGASSTTPLLKEIQNTALSDWTGYDVNFLAVTNPPTLSDLKKYYPDKAPIVIRDKSQNPEIMWVYYVNKSGEAVLIEDPDLEKVYAYSAKSFSDTITFGQNLNPLVYSILNQKQYHSQAQSLIDQLNSIDYKTIDNLFSKMLDNNIKLPQDVTQLLHYYMLNKMPKGTHLSLKTLMYFARNNIHMARRSEQYRRLKSAFQSNGFIEEKINFLLDQNVNAEIKSEMCCAIQEEQIIQIINVLNSKNTGNAFEPSLKGLLLAIISSTDDWQNNYDFVDAMKRSNPEVVKNAFSEILPKITLPFIEQVKTGKISLSDIERMFIFIEWDKINLRSELALQLLKYLNDETMPESDRQKLFEVLLKKDILLFSSPSNENKFHDALTLYITYLIKHWEDHKDFIASLNTKDFAFLKHAFDAPQVAANANFKKFINDIKQIPAGNLATILNYIKENMEQALIHSFSADESLIKDNIEHTIATMFDSFISETPGLIYFEQGNETREEHVEKSPRNINTIYNNHGYVSFNPKNTKTNTFEKGRPLFLDDEKTIPIGYNIHLPTPPIQNIIVKVYGGNQASDDKDDTCYFPGYYTEIEKHMLNEGTAVITLNLPDILKLQEFQNQMPEDLFLEIQACIDKFYNTIRENPQSLHPSLKGLDKQKIYLKGESFGGAMALRHAQLYPHTFDGYISHDGSISRSMSIKSDHPMTRHIAQSPELYLDPSQKNELKKIQDPILLMHNKDDHNVNAKVTLDFYKRLKAQGKEELARVCITQIGNPQPHEKYNNKGHYIPTGKKEFERYADTLSSFMTKGPSSLPAVSEWQGFQQNTLANKFLRTRNFLEDFIAQALEHYKLNNHQHSSLKTLWDRHYRDLFYAIAFANEAANTTPLLLTEIKRLKDENLLSDQIIINMLKSQSNIFSQYIQETYKFAIPKDVDITAVLTSKENIEKLRNDILNLENRAPIIRRFFLATLYKANPDLLKPHYLSFASNPAVVKTEQKAKMELDKVITKDKKMISNVWQQTAEKALNQQRNKQAIVHRWQDTVREAVKHEKQTNLDLITSKLNKITQKPPAIFTDIYREIINLSRISLYDKAELTKLDQVFNHFSNDINKLDQTKRPVYMNIIMAKITQALISQDADKIEKTLEQCLNFMLKQQYPNKRASHIDKEKCKETIERYYVDLKSQLPVEALAKKKQL
ncbi:prolyl oligopeptidase family serine peptidase [Candidatus Berkiella aquae]|uniref:Prolyl oligopeptidase family protein n=1 Tax=Candidatus Berkiella aquae TaxID=295108 RepID=A0A0Q9Z2E9_9GAMM|nr:prolyl oligopeptidase family serine peptidase [Candidatus Berkiella aquae]MCS5711992.1 prolyl oligopeptidase family serine peptidase [Candidatus Berkiella aquae]